MENIIYLCYKTSYLSGKVNRTKPFPSVSVPCHGQTSDVTVYMSCIYAVVTLLNLKLKTLPKQLLGYLPLDIPLPGLESGSKSFFSGVFQRYVGFATSLQVRARATRWSPQVAPGATHVQGKASFTQGKLSEGEGSVQLTSSLKVACLMNKFYNRKSGWSNANTRIKVVTYRKLRFNYFFNHNVELLLCKSFDFLKVRYFNTLTL